MCGIVGAIGNFDAQHAKFFDQMVFIDTIRGPHSTGLVSVNVKEKDSSVYKTMNPGHLAVMEDEWKKARGLWDAAWIGHNRYATHGAVNLENAHPFKHGDITGVHNGSLEWGWEYDLQILQCPTFGTDSESIFWAIETYGIEEALKYCDGAYALVYYDAEENSMNFITNGERPLHYVTTYDGRAMYFSSLEEILWTLEAQGRNSACSLGVTRAFKKNILYTLNLPDKVTDIDFKDGKWEFIETPMTGGSETYSKRSTPHTPASSKTNKKIAEAQSYQLQSRNRPPLLTHR